MKATVMIAMIASLFFVLPQSVKSAASDYNNLCAACTGSGYSFCPTTGVCFDPTVPISNTSISTSTNTTVKAAHSQITTRQVNIEKISLT